MSLEVEATYQNGVLKPSQELPLQEGQKVTITIQPVETPPGDFPAVFAGLAIPKNFAPT